MNTFATPAEARAIAKEAYIYGFPLVDNYRIQYASFVDSSNPQFKAPWNRIYNIGRVYGPADTTIQTPNSDTPYSHLGLDLRREPIVLRMPAMEKNRYFCVQLIDAYTFNFDYIGTRTTGNDGGVFLIAGPSWKGEVPKGITKVFHSETELVYALYRTQLFDPDDIENVKRLQADYKVQPLSEFTGQSAPPAATAVNWVEPLTPKEQQTSLQFFNILNFVLQFCLPANPSEVELMQRFAKIDVGGGLNFDSNSPEMKSAVQQGMADAWIEFDSFVKQEVDTGKTTSGDVFGTREYLKNNYLYRMAGAVVGIYGNSKGEAIYPVYNVDAEGKPLDGSQRYTLRFAEDGLPPANAFWSLTMYALPASLLVANPIDRYLVNSPMMPHFKRDADGGITLHLQHDSPGSDMEANWLPAPGGPFRVIMRIYWPKPEALDGTWQQPPLKRWTGS